MLYNHPILRFKYAYIDIFSKSHGACLDEICLSRWLSTFKLRTAKVMPYDFKSLTSFSYNFLSNIHLSKQFYSEAKLCNCFLFLCNIIQPGSWTSWDRDIELHHHSQFRVWHSTLKCSLTLCERLWDKDG